MSQSLARALLLAASCVTAACSGSSTDPAPVPDAGLTATAAGPNEILLEWTPPAGISSVVLRDGAPITPALAGTSWVDFDVFADRRYVYAVEVRAAGGDVVARGQVSIRTPAVAPWARRDLYPAGGVGRTAAVVGPDETLLFTFHDASAGALMLGSDGASGTGFVEVARGAMTGRLADLALDSTGQLRIAFESNDDLLLAKPSAATGGFEVEELQHLAEPQALALVVDDSDLSHVVYRALMDQSGLRYQRETTNGWASSSIPALGPTIGDLDVVSLGGGDLAVLYFAGTAGRYTAHVNRRISGSWSTESVTEVDRPFGAMAVDDLGALHLALLDVEEVLHVEETTQGWRTDRLGGAARRARQATIAVSVFGDVHIALHGRALDLVHLLRMDGNWSEEHVDADGNVGEWASIALDRAAPPQIVYHDVTNGVLRVARER